MVVGSVLTLMLLDGIRVLFNLLINKIFKSSIKKRVYKCKTCGPFEVWTNVYDRADSGQGHCKCGECRVIIN